MDAAGQGFPKARRLRKRADFLRVQGQAPIAGSPRGGSPRRVTSPHFTFLLAPQPETVSSAAPPRLGLVVSKRVGNAVARARVKRMCRECFRRWPDLLPEGVDLVVVARGGSPTLGYDDVRREWDGVARLLRTRAEGLRP